MKRDYKQELELFLYANGFVSVDNEYKYHPTRKWRFDYCIPGLEIAIEYEGLMGAKSRHTTIRGFTNDCEKYNEATILGWKVIRVTVISIENGQAFDQIERLLKTTQYQEARQ